MIKSLHSFLKDSVGPWTTFCWAIILSIFLLIAVGLTRVLFFTWVDNYQFAYSYDYWNGRTAAVSHGGYVYTPFYRRSVHTIDLRPMQVCISSIQRVLNCKLVHFDPYAKDPETKLRGWELFIKWHGRSDYEGPGTNGSSGTESGSGKFKEILMNYAYVGTGRSYPFLVVEKELKNDSTEPATQGPVVQKPPTNSQAPKEASQ